MKRPRFPVRGMMILVAIVAIGICSYMGYQRYQYYHSMMVLYHRLLGKELLDIESFKAEIDLYCENPKRVDQGLEWSLIRFEPKLGTDPELQKIASDYRASRRHDAEENLAESKRDVAEFEQKYKRYKYLCSHPWIIDDPDRDDDEDDNEDDNDDPDLPPTPTPVPPSRLTP